MRGPKLICAAVSFEIKSLLENCEKYFFPTHLYKTKILLPGCSVY